MRNRAEESRIRYVSSMQRIATSLELLTYDHADDIDPEDTREIVDIITRLHRFIEKCAKRAAMRRVGQVRLN